MTIEERLKHMIVERLFLKVDPESIDDDASLMETYGIDSVSLLELVVALEDEFDIDIEDEEFDVKNFENVAALKTFIEPRLD